MARSGQRPATDKSNYISLPTIPANKKLSGIESNWVNSKALEPWIVEAFPVVGTTVSVNTIDENTFEEYTQVGQLDFVTANTVVAGEGIGNGLFGVFVASGDTITFTADFDISIPATFTAAAKYIIHIAWSGEAWVGYVCKAGESNYFDKVNDNTDDITQSATKSFLDSAAAPQTIAGVKDFTAQVKGGDLDDSFSATKTFDMDNGNMQKMSVTSNVTSLALSNKVSGSSYLIILEIAGSGGYTIASPAASFGTQTDNSVDNADWPTTVGSKIIINVNVEPDADTHYSCEIITV